MNDQRYSTVFLVIAFSILAMNIVAMTCIAVLAAKLVCRLFV